MEHKVTLQFFQDDANGEWGLTTPDAVYNGFNAFWNGVGIFHDVFEHWFENEHKYFKGEYAYNVAGEVCAMGAMLYFCYGLNVCERSDLLFLKPSSFRQPDIILSINSFIGEIEDAVHCGYSRFGDTFKCRVPRQQRASHIIHEAVSEISYKIKGCTLSSSLTTEERQFAKDYLKSVQRISKFHDLYAYGWKMANKIVPDTPQNKEAIAKFLNYWTALCKNVEAKELAPTFSKIEFVIHTGEEIRWSANFVSRDIMVSDYEITDQTTFVPYAEDFFSELHND